MAIELKNIFRLAESSFHVVVGPYLNYVICPGFKVISFSAISYSPFIMLHIFRSILNPSFFFSFKSILVNIDYRWYMYFDWTNNPIIIYIH